MFAHLSKLDISDKTHWVEFPEIHPDARVQILAAGESNPAYFSAALRKYGQQKAKAKTRQLSVADFDEARESERDLFGRFVVISWESLPAKEGGMVPFSRENAMDLCAHLPDWLFDRLRHRANEPSNFLDIGEDPLPDAAELAKNSESGSATI